MSDMEAEKAWARFDESYGLSGHKPSFMAGRASRDADVAEALNTGAVVGATWRGTKKPETVVERAWREHPDEMARAHTELHVAALRERVAELEAALTKSEAVCDSAAAILSNPGKHGGVPQALAKAREVFGTQVNTTLAAVKRETAAQALEAFADTLGVDVSDDDSDELRGYRNGQRQAIRKATERAAALRSGTEGSN